jgi:uncharacterized repeat protein (TIGR01451 family)
LKTRGFNSALLSVLIITLLIVSSLLISVESARGSEIVNSVEVEVSPTRISAGPGENITFTVYVTNAGDIADNYNLTLIDKLGWGSTLSATSTTVAAGALRVDISLRVTIPENAQPYAEDNLTVTVVSQTDSTVMDSNSCIAQAIIASNYPSYVLAGTLVLPLIGIAMALYLLFYLRRH